MSLTGFVHKFQSIFKKKTTTAARTHKRLSTQWEKTHTHTHSHHQKCGINCRRTQLIAKHFCPTKLMMTKAINKR